MLQMSELDDAETCRCVLASAAVLYRPVTISELVALVEQLEDVGDDVREIVSLCGSFLTLREDIVMYLGCSRASYTLSCERTSFRPYVFSAVASSFVVANF